MAPIPLSFGLASNRGRYLLDNSVSVVNAYAEQLGTGGKAEFALYAAPGLRPFAELPTGPFRGAANVRDALLVVSGQYLYSVGPTGAFQKLGQIPGSDPVSIEADALAVPNVAIVASGRLFILRGGTLSEFQDDSLPPPVDVSYLNGRFIFPTADGRFTFSDVNALTFSAFTFYNAEGKQDGLVACWERRKELWLFGDRTFEVWSPTTNSLDPFTPGVARGVGCLSGASVAEIADRLFWVDNEFNIRMAEGYDATNIATPFVNRVISSDPRKETIVGHAYTIAGVSYYEISGAAFTLRYSLKTGQWTERQTIGRSRWRGAGAVQATAGVIVGDFETGNLYTLDADYPRDGDEDILVRLVSPIIHTWPGPLTLHSLHADIITAVGQNTSDSVIDDPVAMLRLSEDGGKSWFGPLDERLGKSGEATRVIWRQLGTFERAGAAIELSISASVARCIMQAMINGESGTT